jgi:hypothetical protein
MPKSKQRKNHKQKVAARKTKLENDKKRAKKAQHDFLMNLIKREQDMGLFDNNDNIDPLTIDSITEGPSI